MKKISLILLLAILGCQDAETPTSTLMADLGSESTFSNIPNGKFTHQNLLTRDDRKLLSEELLHDGYNLSPEEFNFYVEIIEVTIQTVQSMEGSMPRSLSETTLTWDEVTKQDTEAAAFVEELEHTIMQNLSTIEVPEEINPCWDHQLVQNMASCLNDFKLVCKYFGLERCVTISHISDLLHCLAHGCYPIP